MKTYKEQYLVKFEDFTEKRYIVDGIRQLPDLIDNDEELNYLDFGNVQHIDYEGIVEIIIKHV